MCNIHIALSGLCGLRVSQAPKKINVIVSQMGLTVLDSSRKPVTNILYQKLKKWRYDAKTLYITPKGKGESIIQFRTGLCSCSRRDALNFIAMDRTPS